VASALRWGGEDRIFGFGHSLLNGIESPLHHLSAQWAKIAYKQLSHEVIVFVLNDAGWHIIEPLQLFFAILIHPFYLDPWLTKDVDPNIRNAEATLIE